MSRYILIYSQPDGVERRFELVSGRSYRIGAKKDNDVVIVQKDVSRHHAVLRALDSSFLLTDLKSKNGTFLNGRRIESEDCHCGDQINISSARLTIVEVSTGAYQAAPVIDSKPSRSNSGVSREQTVQFRGEATVADLVELLENTAAAAARGAVADPLSWAVERLGVLGAVVLYRDTRRSVAMVSSAGDLGPLVKDSAVLTRLVLDRARSDDGIPGLVEVEELGETLIIASLQPGHVLVVRYSGDPPAVEDLRALSAAVRAVLTASASDAGGRAASGPDPTVLRFFEELADQPLDEARDGFERWFLTRILDESNGAHEEAAARLGISRSALTRRMRKLRVSA